MARTPTDRTSAPAVGFDVRAYAASATSGLRDALDLDSFRARPLSGAALDAVVALEVLQRRTTHRLRSLLVTPTHADAAVTAFLGAWAYEGHGVADALRAVREQHPGAGAGAGPLEGAARAGAPAGGLRALARRFAPLTSALWTNLLGARVVAMHMTTSAVDTWITQAAYRGLAQREGHPGLAAACALLHDVKERQQAFFAEQAAVRLAASRGARALTRLGLRARALPLGSEVLTPTQRAALAGALPLAAAADVDARAAALPGLRRARPARRARTRLARGVAA